MVEQPSSDSLRAERERMKRREGERESNSMTESERIRELKRERERGSLPVNGNTGSTLNLR